MCSAGGLRIPDWINKGIRLSPTERPISRIRPAMFRNLSITIYAPNNHHINYDDDWGRRDATSPITSGRSELARRGSENPSSWIRRRNRAMTHAASGYRSSAFTSPGNLLVTAHVLISLPLSLRMRRTRARATRVRPFRFACRNILNSLSDRIIKATRARANLLRTRRESRERLARTYSRPFNKIDGRPPCGASFLISGWGQ